MSRVESHDPRFLVHYDEEGARSVRSRASFAAGEELTCFWARTESDRPQRLSVQVSESRHIELEPAFLECTNHGCEPNVFFDTAAFVLVSLRPIAPGDELRFFYPSTEWKMSEPFECACGAEACLGVIEGASATPRAVLARYRLAPHIEAALARSSEPELHPHRLHAAERLGPESP